MYIRQTDLFWGLSQNVVNRVMAMAEREAFAKGDVLFHSGDAGPASVHPRPGRSENHHRLIRERRYTREIVWERPSAGACLIDGDK